ncbi:hypothetical protein NFB59_17055, partial [Yersinia ruckeri]|nr:hypothetical protein [Yersinia ruckeri]
MYWIAVFILMFLSFFSVSVKFFIILLISSLSHYQHAYHQAVGETEKRLKHKLVEIFSDPRTVEIVA